MVVMMVIVVMLKTMIMVAGISLRMSRRETASTLESHSDESSDTGDEAH